MPICGMIFFGCSTLSTFSPTVVCVRFDASHSTSSPTPPCFFAVRSALSLIHSIFSRSISFLSMFSIFRASASSFFHSGITFGIGIVESTIASMFSAVMFQTCAVVRFLPSLSLSLEVVGRSVRSPLYCASRSSIFKSSAPYALMFLSSLSCHFASSFLLLSFILSSCLC